MLISQPIPTLIGGISQQAPSFRRPNQCEDALNVYNDPVNGVKKRPGSSFINTLDTSFGAYYGSITRDEQNKFIFSISPAGVKVWDLEGQERVVNVVGDTQYIQGSARFKHITIADTTFIVNTNIEVTESGTLTPPTSPVTSMAFVKQAINDTNYFIAYGGGGTTHSTPASGSIDSIGIATSLANGLSASVGIPVAPYLHTVLIKDPSPPYPVMYASTTSGDSLLDIFPGVAESLSDLPKTTEGGVKMRIKGGSNSSSEYYAVFDGTEGVWTESVKTGISEGIDPSTMPHVLISEADGTFTFKPFEWDKRLVGDDNSNPQPSFVGSKINNILYERGRLGFLSDVSLILSESNQVGNFYRTTVTTVVDSDPIDVSVSGRQVDILKTSIGVKDGVLLFSDESQYLLNIGDADILSPETVSITAVSSYQSNTAVEPVRVGDSILFITLRDQNSGVREYFYESGRDFTQSASITAHVPKLLPNNLSHISGSSTENIAFFRATETTEMYTYQFLYSGEDKVVSSWGRWDFNGREVIYTQVFDDYLYVILRGSQGTTLERVPVSNSFLQTSLPGEVCLDSYVLSPSVTRTFGGTNTAVQIPHIHDTDRFKVVSLSDTPGGVISAGSLVTPLSITENSLGHEVVLPGNWEDNSFIAGVTYSFKYEFSPFYMDVGEGEVEIAGRLQIRNLKVQLRQTGNIQFRVIYGGAGGGVESSLTYVSDIQDWSEIQDMSTLGEPGATTGVGEVYTLDRAFPEFSLDKSLNLIRTTFLVPIMCENTGYRLIAENDGWQPVSITKGQWEALYHKRSRLLA